MADCILFNKPLVIPNGVAKIYNMFMYGCSKFSQRLIIPDSVTLVDYFFMVNCNYLSYLNVGSNPSVDLDGLDSSSLSSNSRYSPAVVIGVKVEGANASKWKSKLPNSSSGQYRNLI